MKNFLNFEEVLELVKVNDEKVFKSEKYDLYFTFSGLVDEVDKRCQYGSDYDLVDDVYKEMVEDIFKVFKPITLPSALTKAPPLLPEFIAASV